MLNKGCNALSIKQFTSFIFAYNRSTHTVTKSGLLKEFANDSELHEFFKLN
jgi:hypothetical protein